MVPRGGWERPGSPGALGGVCTGGARPRGVKPRLGRESADRPGSEPQAAPAPHSRSPRGAKAQWGGGATPGPAGAVGLRGGGQAWQPSLGPEGPSCGGAVGSPRPGDGRVRWQHCCQGWKSP